MARTKIVLVSSEVEAMLKSAGVRAVLVGPADRVEAAAKASAPVASGAYRDSIHRESATTDRAVELVVADAAHARVVESRTGNLARALGSVGGA